MIELISGIVPENDEPPCDCMPMKKIKENRYVNVFGDTLELKNGVWVLSNTKIDYVITRNTLEEIVIAQNLILEA